MSAGGVASWHQLVLLRDGHPSAPGLDSRRLIGITRLPVWAAAGHRVDLPLRQLVDGLGRDDGGSGLTSEEAHAWFEGAADAVPVMALLSSSALVVAAVRGERAHVAVELTQDGFAGRTRFQALCHVVAALRGAGFARLVDHASGVTLAATDAVLADRLGVAEGARTSQETSLDVRAALAIGAALGVVFGLSLVIENRPSLPVSIAVVAGAGVWTAILAAGSAWWHERWKRATHLRRFRASLLPDRVESPVQDYAADPSWWQEGLTATVFGGLVWFSVSNGEPLAAAGFVVVLAVVFAYSVAVRAAHVEVDATGLTGLTVRGRRRITFCDIDWISSTRDPEPRVVHALEVGRIWIPRHVDEGERLLERLWTAARAAGSHSGDAIAGNDVARQAALVDDVRRRVVAARRATDGGDITRHGAWQPLWLRLLRPHPLRAQFKWQRHLLERGHVVLAHVTSASWMLVVSGADHQASDVPATVVFSTSQAWRGGVAAVSRISGCVEQLLCEGREDEPDVQPNAPGEAGSRAPLSAPALAFAQALRRNAGNPLMVPVPAELGGGRGVFCTSLIVVRRHLPLGSLASWWLPLLVDPGTCPYAMVVPLRHWPRAVRRAWKAGTAPEPDQATNAEATAPAAGGAESASAAASS